MKRKWWKEGIVYQIYPKSFKDSNNDGIGDIKGIIEKIPYLKDLGINIIWLNPIYDSPNDDNGYDIRDYQAILKEFGTMEDFDLLLSELHKNNIKLIMDLVVNHSSDEHNWFVESRKSKDNTYRDYYIWQKEKPNNWGSFFGGSSWEFDELTKEYYLHLFSKKQPDLNWENENLRNDVYSLMKWWLDKGIDGFRMDVINMIAKNPLYPSNSSLMSNGFEDGSKYFLNLPKVHDYLQEMNKKVLSNYDVMTVGECPGTSPKDAILFSEDKRNELSMIFQFELMDIDGTDNKWNYKKWNLNDFKRIINKWQVGLEHEGWNSIYLMNHDRPRAISRFGNDKEYRKESGKLLSMLTLSLKGTPYIYQGEEIGMTNISFDSIDDYKDIETLNYYKEVIDNENLNSIMDKIHYSSRDNSRTPMQWTNQEFGGFSETTPWIKINPNFININVEESLKDEFSILNFYKEMIKFRKNNLALVYGTFTNLDINNENLYSYLRSDNENSFLILLNFSEKKINFELPEEIKSKNKELKIKNYKFPSNFGELKPYEGQIIKLK